MARTRLSLPDPRPSRYIPRIEFTPSSGTSSTGTTPRLALGWKVVAFGTFWTLVGLAFAGQMYLVQLKRGSPVPWGFAVTRSLADWYVFALLSLPAIGFSRRFPLGCAPLPLLAAVHGVASLLFSLLWMLLRAAVEVALEGSSFQESLRQALLATLFFNLLVYWVIIAVAHAASFYESLRERERRTLELERRVTEARQGRGHRRLLDEPQYRRLEIVGNPLGIGALGQDVDRGGQAIARGRDLLLDDLGISLRHL